MQTDADLEVGVTLVGIAIGRCQSASAAEGVLSVGVLGADAAKGREALAQRQCADEVQVQAFDLVAAIEFAGGGGGVVAEFTQIEVACCRRPKTDPLLEVMPTQN